MKYLYMTIEGLDDLLIEVEEGKLSAIRFRGDESAQIIPGQADPVLQKQYNGSMRILPEKGQKMKSGMRSAPRHSRKSVERGVHDPVRNHMDV